VKIYKKTWPELFDDVYEGKKKFDLRLADFEIQLGDTLVLQEWNPEAKGYTGREIEKQVTYVLKTKDWDFQKEEDIKKYGNQLIQLD
jgi:hypothetical protein